jgi:hypothetical protein
VGQEGIEPGLFPGCPFLAGLLLGLVGGLLMCRDVQGVPSRRDSTK